MRIGERHRRTVWIGLSAVGAACILARPWFAAGPERLRDLPPKGSILGIRDGHVYFRPSSSSPVVQAFPATGGEPKTVVPPFDLPGFVFSTALTSSSVMYTCRYPLPETRPVPLPAGAPPTPFATCLYEAPLDGSPSRRLLAELRDELPKVSGEWCWWTREGRREPARVSARSGLYKLLYTDIMASPLRCWEPRTVTRHPRSAQLYSAEAGAFWTVSGASGTSRDLYYAASPEHRVLHLSSRADPGPPLALRDRLYWTDMTREGAWWPSPNSRSRIMTATSSGDEPRVLMDPADDPRWEPRVRIFGGNRGLLFALLVPRGDRSTARVPSLCPIEPRTGAVRRLYEPRDVERLGPFDGSFLYSTVTEYRENWLDWSTKGLRPRRVEVLCRYRLPT